MGGVLATTLPARSDTVHRRKRVATVRVASSEGLAHVQATGNGRRGGGAGRVTCRGGASCSVSPSETPPCREGAAKTRARQDLRALSSRHDQRGAQQRQNMTVSSMRVPRSLTKGCVTAVT